jgi:hypothetical protein
MGTGVRSCLVWARHDYGAGTICQHDHFLPSDDLRYTIKLLDAYEGRYEQKNPSNPSSQLTPPVGRLIHLHLSPSILFLSLPVLSPISHPMALLCDSSLLLSDIYQPLLAQAHNPSLSTSHSPTQGHEEVEAHAVEGSRWRTRGGE